MIKLKAIIQFGFHVLKENCWFIVAYLVMAGFMGSTFFLYDVDAEVYRDALWFSFPILIFALIYRGLTLWRKHQLLLKAIQQQTFHEVNENRYPASILEKDYQELLRQAVHQMDTLTMKHDAQEKELRDYYVLWSHQIKTPLATLNLLSQSAMPETKNEMKEEIFKIQLYLDMILHYLRLQSIHQDFRFEETALYSVAKETIKKYARFFIYKDIEVELKNLGGTIITDKKWFSFMLEQIVFNAIKYTKKGTIILYAPENNSQEIRIKDTGQGILPEDLPRVFERGYTGFNGRENEASSGLGLYMCKEIADKMGIRLTIASQIGEGTEVSIDTAQSLHVID